MLDALVVAGQTTDAEIIAIVRAEESYVVDALARLRALALAWDSPEGLRALTIAFAQVLAAVRPAIVLVAIRVTAQAKLEGIELERGRNLVHRAFKGIDASRGAWTAHVARRRQIEPGELVRILRVVAFVE